MTISSDPLVLTFAEIVHMSENKESRCIKHLYYVVPLLLVLYVMSIGPSYALATNTACDPKPADQMMDLDTYESFYAPVLWVEDKNKPINKLLSKYKRYCFDKMHPGSLPFPP